MHQLVIGPKANVSAALTRARAASFTWRVTPLSVRLRIIRQARRLLAQRAAAIASTMDQWRPAADTLTAEVLPLLAGMRFLERRAPALLATRRLWTGRPLWLFGVAAQVRREPCGVVLILAPSNYPLFLPGSQILQALVAGNTICAKPAPGCAAPLHALSAILTEAGLPEGVLQLLDDSVAVGIAAAGAGFDHIVLTGSARTGREVMTAAAQTLTPSTMELSGNDPLLVLPGADLDVVADALAYGLRLNGGATCIAPRRVFLSPIQAARIEQALKDRVSLIAPVPLPHLVVERLAELVAEAVAQGARLLSAAPDGAQRISPIILTDARASMRLLQEDVFAPWLALVPVADVEQALAALSPCPYALGATVFGPERQAHEIAARLPAGSVCINDLIVPTADPRLPFGGRGQSGFGATRGAEGLLAMTVIKTVSSRRGKFRPHFAMPRSGDAVRHAGLISVLYGGRGNIMSAVRGMRHSEPP
jgi:acyl-CoA reductase-like NAD-dependent aldehyde dehydrogenase